MRGIYLALLDCELRILGSDSHTLGPYLAYVPIDRCIQGFKALQQAL